MCGEWHEEKQQPTNAPAQGQTFCARAYSLFPGEKLPRASIKFGPFQPPLKAFRRQFPRRVRHD